jgi:hypothetical protein
MTRKQSVKAICMLEAVAFAGMCAVGCWGGIVVGWGSRQAS